ncbi:MAG: hypothetical protein NTU53_08205 [Planctomycetota bacterium]|nr:hypothetical protein [Planctomycetota bacterium]
MAELHLQGQLLSPARGRFKIGIAWQANPRHTSAVRRSAPLAAFEPLSRVDGAKLISLQRRPGLEQLKTSSFPVADLGPEVDTKAGAFMDTAAIMKGLDLVVTVNTLIAHLVGALGVPAWVLLPFVSERRWMRGRADGPWYPTMRLYRQERFGDWRGAFEQVISDLRRRLG